MRSLALVFHSLDFTDTGTTTGYADDYDEVCPYSGSTSPDVVYHYVPEGPQGETCVHADIDLLGSSYDTKVYVYDSALQLRACNDDFYADYISKIEAFGFLRDEEYFIVIDGWSGDHGDYVLNVVAYAGCYVACSPDDWPEGETIADELPDLVNSGCDGDAGAPAIQTLPLTASGLLDVCGTGGWRTVAGEARRDIDWFSLVVGSTGVVEGNYMDTLGATVQVIQPGDCGDLAVQSSFEADICAENPFLIVGDPGAEMWLRLATPAGSVPCNGITPQAWEYVLQLQGLQQAVAVEAHSWSAVRGRFGGSRRR